MYERYIKRAFDFTIALAGLVLFWWIYAIIAILIHIKLGSPIIFTQERPGKDGKIFKLYKFRTMTGERDENGELLPDEMRLTKFGKTLRSSSLDELPELFNMLKGDLSLIGPRPLLVEYLPYYTQEENRRHSVRPGLTGLAQINGRNALTWEEKFAFDIEYVDNMSFIQDAKVFIKTFEKLFKKSDVLMGVSLPVGRLDTERSSQAEIKEYGG